MRIVEETGLARNVLMISLKRRGPARMRALRPDWPMGIVAARAIGDLAASFLAMTTGQVSGRLIRRAHGTGKKVWATVDDPRRMWRMISAGVDGLIPRNPALVRAVPQDRKVLALPKRLLLWLVDSSRSGNLDLPTIPSFTQTLHHVGS